MMLPKWDKNYLVTVQIYQYSSNLVFVAGIFNVMVGIWNNNLTNIFVALKYFLEVFATSRDHNFVGTNTYCKNLNCVLTNKHFHS
jgi:uncharacterized membrane protein YiaA